MFYRSRLLVFLLMILCPGALPAPEAYAQAQPAAATTQDDAQAPAPLTDEELEVLVARIALYPDELVAVVTSASLFPLQIVEAARFLDNRKKDASLKPKDSWDGSIISLLNYPDIVKMMSDDLEWTQSLGQALAYQQKDVLVAIQQLREKAVADGVIKSDDKMKVETKNDNIVIQSASTETIYIPKYEPQMLYDPAYEPVPVSYYSDSYPYYYYPTATFFAGAVTGAIFGAVVDWDDWGVWGGRWDGGDVDIDCNKCFNNVDIDGKLNFKDVDWKNVDRSKINFDRNQFANIDRDQLTNNFKSFKDNNVANRAKSIRTEGAGAISGKVNKISVDDVRKSKVEANRRAQANRGDARPKQNVNAGDRSKASASASRKASNVGNKARSSSKISKPRPGGKVERRGGGGNRSALGKVQRGKHTQVQSRRGQQSLGRS
ncbi:MAG: DUF3300 domain-containing protein, partial [Pararhizobium sp.]